MTPNGIEDALSCEVERMQFVALNAQAIRKIVAPSSIRQMRLSTRRRSEIRCHLPFAMRSCATSLALLGALAAQLDPEHITQHGVIFEGAHYRATPQTRHGRCPLPEALWECEVTIPFLSGFGITVALLPGELTYYYISDGGQFVWDGAVRQLAALGTLCL